MKSKKRHWILRGILGIASGVLSILSLPPVRNFIWNKLVKRGKKKVIDVEAKMVEKDEEEEKRLFR